MKKFLTRGMSAAIVVAMLLSFSACGKDQAEKSAETSRLNGVTADRSEAGNDNSGTDEETSEETVKLPNGETVTISGTEENGDKTSSSKSTGTTSSGSKTSSSAKKKSSGSSSSGSTSKPGSGSSSGGSTSKPGSGSSSGGSTSKPGSGSSSGGSTSKPGSGSSSGGSTSKPGSGSSSGGSTSKPDGGGSSGGDTSEPTDPKPPVKTWTLQDFINYVISYGTYIGLTYDSNANPASFDTPIILTAPLSDTTKIEYKKSEIEAYLNRYKREGDEYFWIHTERRSDGKYVLYIGY